MTPRFPPHRPVAAQRRRVVPHGRGRLPRSGRIFATLASEKEGYGNLMLDLEQQTLFVTDAREIFLPIQGGWGRMGMTHIRLNEADEPTLTGALRAAYNLRMQKNAATEKSSPRKPK